MIRSGFFRRIQEYRFPAVFGRDVAGVVEQVGSGVTRFGVGDAVYGFVKRDAHRGRHLRRVRRRARGRSSARCRAGSSLAEAGVARPSPGVTALECVDAVPSGPGDVVLVNGATGGVGLLRRTDRGRPRAPRWSPPPGPPEQVALVRRLGRPTSSTGGRRPASSTVRAVAPDGIDGFVDLVKHVDSTEMGVGEDEAHTAFARLCRGLLRDGRPGVLGHQRRGARAARRHPLRQRPLDADPGVDRPAWPRWSRPAPSSLPIHDDVRLRGDRGGVRPAAGRPGPRQDLRRPRPGSARP